MPELASIDLRPGGAHAAPIQEELLALAPLHLPCLRTTRYKGENQCIRSDELAPRDQEILHGLYDLLTDLLLRISDTSSDDAQRWRDVDEWILRNDLGSLVDTLRTFGVSSLEGNPGEMLAKCLHDVRGGAMSALVGRLQLLNFLPRDEATLQTLFVLARDHHKIMRSAVTDLDEGRRDADHRPKSHDVQLTLKKWHESVVGPRWRVRPVRLFIDCRHEGPLSECCLESAALDRIFYDLANDATRRVAGDRLDMAIFPVPQAPGENLRFVLSYPVDEPTAKLLCDLNGAEGSDSTHLGLGRSLAPLFDSRISSGESSDFGLMVMADFVAGAFGLRDRQQALQERYAGAVFDGETFRLWFHWPVAHPTPEQKLDDYHRPKDSLTEAESGIG